MKNAARITSLVLLGAIAGCLIVGPAAALGAHWKLASWCFPAVVLFLYLYFLVSRVRRHFQELEEAGKRPPSWPGLRRRQPERPV